MPPGRKCRRGRAAGYERRPSLTSTPCACFFLTCLPLVSPTGFNNNCTLMDKTRECNAGACPVPPKGYVGMEGPPRPGTRDVASPTAAHTSPYHCRRPLRTRVPAQGRQQDAVLALHAQHVRQRERHAKLHLLPRGAAAEPGTMPGPCSAMKLRVSVFGAETRVCLLGPVSRSLLPFPCLQAAFFPSSSFPFPNGAQERVACSDCSDGEISDPKLTNGLCTSCYGVRLGATRRR